jgi:hypothetical protein
MAAEINSKYKKFRCSALLATVRARAHVLCVWFLPISEACQLFWHALMYFANNRYAFVKEFVTLLCFWGGFWDLNHTSCVSVVAILCYWRSFLKALYEHGSSFIVLLLRMSEFRCRKSVPSTICVFLWKVERRIALFLFLISDEFLPPSYNAFHPVIPLLCSRWLLSSDDAYWNKLCVIFTTFLALIVCDFLKRWYVFLATLFVFSRLFLQERSAGVLVQTWTRR